MKSKNKIKKYISEHRSLLCFVVNFFCISAILIVFWLSKTLKDYDNSIKLALIIFAVDIIISWGIISFGKSAQNPKGKKKGRSDAKPLIRNLVTLDLIQEFKSPVLIADSKGYILWRNEAAGEYFSHEENGEIIKKSVAAISGNQLSAEKFAELAEESKAIKTRANQSGLNERDLSVINVLINGKYFAVELHKLGAENTGAVNVSEVSGGASAFDIFVFTDITELEYMRYEAEMKDPAAAYFVIDNLDEAIQKTQNKYSASGAVNHLLNEFIEDCGGVIKEYDKDKYLCFFENRALKNFMKSKFGILDSVRDIKLAELSMPITISGGVSDISGSLFEKEEAARRALDLALQRGGDQVVVRGLSDVFFGGKTKTVQKRTKVKSRVIATELAEHIENSSNILIMGHKYADNDSIGSCVGLARFARALNIDSYKADTDINIIVNIHDSNIKSAFAKLRGLEEYKDIFIDETAALDKITADTLVIVADVNNTHHFESEAVYKNAYKCVIIDHHRKNTEYVKEPDMSYIDPSASSTSELVAEILEQTLAPGQLLKEEAELLLAGIILDTKSFSRDTGAKTFSAAVYLRGEGANPSDALALSAKTDLEEFMKEALFASNIIKYRNTAISVYEDAAAITDKTAGAKAADRMLTIDGISASFVICRIDDTVHVSARSLDNVNVQVIMESLGGGGHFNMAGAQLRHTSLKNALITLKKTIDEYFDSM